MPSPNLWLGTWKLGGMHFGPYEEKTALSTLSLAIESGITHYDTAHFYAKGNSNKVLAKALKNTQRNKVFISSKGGLHWQTNTVKKNASPKALKTDLEKTLQNLNTDHLDLYSLHYPDPNTPIEESLSALKQFKTQGLIKEWGICNFTESQLKTHIPKNTKPPHQIHHNLIHQNTRLVEDNRCIPIITSPLEQGLLSEKGLSHITQNDHRNTIAATPHTLNLFQHSIQKTAYEYLLNNPKIDNIITGARTPDQLSETLKYFNARTLKSTNASK